MDVTSDAGDLKSDVHGVHLRQGEVGGNDGAIIFHAAAAQCQHLALGDLAKHPGELVLNQLKGCNGLVELNSRF